MKFSEMPYERINLDDLKEKSAEFIKEFKEAPNGEEQFLIHQRYHEMMNDIDTMMTIAKVRYDVDMSNEFYEQEQRYYDEISPVIKSVEVEYLKALYHSPYREALESRIGKVAFKNMELKFKSFDDKLVPLLQEENALGTEYSKLIAKAKIDWNGETLNLSLLRKHMTDKNRETRKLAYKKASEFYQANAEELDTIYDKLVSLRTEQAKILGYENYIELGYSHMQRNCYGREQVEAFRNQVKEVWVPFACELHEKRRKRLGVDVLKHYDELALFPDGNPEPIGTPEEILKNGQKMYQELSKETKEFFDCMIENELFDVLGRKNKRAGGYMTSFHKYKVPFVFANFNGTAGDIDVITHECGHAFQGFIQRDEEIMEHRNITMETAETHSMSMEFFTEPWMKLFFGDRTDDYLLMHLEEAIYFIPYGCMVDEFQHIVYENPSMTPDERNAAWRNLEKVYKPHLDYDGDPYFEKGGFWQKQHHIYNMPFYYIDYCIAQVCAFMFKVKMDENYQKAWENYLKLCKMGASDFFTNMIPLVGLKLPFEEGCLKEIADSLKQHYQA